MRILLFSTAAFLGAALIFWVEPLFARFVLPLLGGAPAVWNTCLVFFQVALLGGYLYAHFGVGALGVRRHAALHVVLLAVSLLLLPVTTFTCGRVPPGACGSLALA